MIAESAMADEAMVLATAQPDPLEIALREHSLLVYRISYSVLGDRAEADDATQETFLRALRYGKKFERIQNPKAWLARVAWRVAVERRNHRQTADAEVETNAHEIASRTTGAEQVLLEQERSVLLNALLAALPGTLRHPLILSSIEELSAREVADTLGISEAAVRSRAFRARQILKERLQSLMGDRK